MVYNRGTEGAFARWADEVGDRSWNWENVYPYYRKSPNYTPANASIRAGNSSSSTVDETASFSTEGGPLQVSLANYAQPWSSFFPEGFEEVGIPFLSRGINSGVLHGYASVTFTEDPVDETRSSSETAFLRTALADTDIVVYTHALAKKIQFDATKRATGVLVEVSDMKFHLNATREIVLCAGALQSPQLLMVSGVGPSTTLDQHQIPVVADRPGVGQNMWVSLFVSIIHMPAVNVDRTIHS